MGIRKRNGLVKGKELYYIQNNWLYKSDFEGSNVEKIISGEDIGNRPPREIWGINVYEEDIYLLLDGLQVVKLDADKKIKEVASDVRRGCFYGQAFYYLDRDHMGIWKVDLSKMESDLVRSDDAYYGAIEVSDGKLYYACTDEKNQKTPQIFQYCEDGEDVQTHLFTGNVKNYTANVPAFSNSSEIGYYCGEDIKTSVKIYNFKSGEREIQLPKGGSSIDYVVDDLALYEDPNDDGCYATFVTK